MNFLLDTNVVSELRKGDRADARVRAWFDSVETDDLYVSVVVIGELRQGVEGVHRRDPATGVRLRRWLTAMVKHYGDRILPIDLSVADTWGRLNVPDRLPVVDGFLAATALEFDMTLVTRNVRDVKRTGVRLLNPFEVAQPH